MEYAAGPATDFLTRILFPRRCPVCGNIVPFGKGLICRSCFSELSFIKSPCCKKCGKEVMNERIEYCYDCSRHVRHFQRGMALLNYNEAAARSMAGIKYHNKREYLDFYGEAAVRRYGKAITRIDPDVLIPVPIHPSRLRSRGFNQAEIFARIIGKRLGIPVRTDILKRNRKTDPQKELTPKERLQNLEQAFSAEGMPNHIHRVLLADDIYTTGSTIEACTRALKQQGVDEIYFLTICIGYGR
ncbi:ComF family protein [Lachnospiraceae bacterium 62-35]